MKKALYILALLLLVTAVMAQRNIQLSLVNQDPDPVEPGSTVDVRVKVDNKGNQVVNNVQLEIIPDYPFSLVSSENPIKEIGTLNTGISGASAEIKKWKLRVADDAPAGVYNLEVQYYVNGVAVKGTPLKIDVISSEAILMVSRVSIQPEKLEPGRAAVLTMNLINLADITLDDIRLKLQLDGLPFAVIGSTNEFTIDQMLRDEQRSVTFDIITLPDAVSKVYSVPITLSFFDNKGKETNRSSSIGLIVDETPEYILNLEESQIVVPNQKGDVVISMSNIGISEIKFVTMELLPGEGYTVLSSPKIYLGNFESDDFETADFDVYSTQTGDIPLNIRVTYKDSFNRPYKEDIQVPIRVYTSKDAEKFGLKAKKSFAAPILFLALITAGIWWWKKRKKRK